MLPEGGVRFHDESSTCRAEVVAIGEQGPVHLVVMGRFYHGGGPEALVRGLSEYFCPKGHRFALFSLRRIDRADVDKWERRLGPDASHPLAVTGAGELESRAVRLVALSLRVLLVPVHLVFGWLSGRRWRDVSFAFGERIEEALLSWRLSRRILDWTEASGLESALATVIVYHVSALPAAWRATSVLRARGRRGTPRLVYCEITLPRARRSTRRAKTCMKRCDAVVAPAREVAEELRSVEGFDGAVQVLPWLVTWGDEYFRRAQKKKGAVGADADRGAMPAEGAGARGRCVFGTIGRLSHEKRMDHLASAFVALANSPTRPHGVRLGLEILGSGPLLEELRGMLGDSICEDPDGRETWARIRPEAWDVAAEFFGAIDVYVSTSEFEGFSVAMIEAMACGLPVLATSVGGAADWVDDEIGRRIDVGDLGALIESMRWLAADPELRYRLGAAARRRFEEHLHPQVLGPRYERLLSPATSGGSDAPSDPSDTAVGSS